MYPENVDLLIHASWIIPIVPENATFSDCAVAVHDGRIVAVCPTEEAERRFQARRTLHLEDHVLLPGMVNAHNHIPMSLLRGYADDRDLRTWLEEHIWPAEARWLSEEFVRDGSELAIAEMIRSGTTCFSDMYFFPDQVATAARQQGMRCQVAFPVINFPSAWARDGDEYLHKGLELHDACKESELISVAFGPHAPYTVDDSLFEKTAVYVNELDARVQIHLHETAREVEEAVAATGERPLARLHRLGLLSPATQCVHMTAANEEDMALLSATHASVIHCPRSNLKLGNGFCPVVPLVDAGINVALGTDGAASNNSQDMFSEMQFAALVTKGVNGDSRALGTHQVLRMATLDGARALGLESRIGSIETGKAADLVAVRLDGAAQQPLYNPASQLIYTQAGSLVSHVWVAGRALMEDRQLTSLNEHEVIVKARAWRERIAG